MAREGVRDRLCGRARGVSWLPSLDSNQGCVIQSHECYHYTTRQSVDPVNYTTVSFVDKGNCDKMTIAIGAFV